MYTTTIDSVVNGVFCRAFGQTLKRQCVWYALIDRKYNMGDDEVMLDEKILRRRTFAVDAHVFGQFQNRIRTTGKIC